MLYWILGIAIALLGVVIARVLGPQLSDDYQFYSMVVGSTIAVIGIFVTALGAGKRRPVDAKGRNAKPE